MKFADVIPSHHQRHIILLGMAKGSALRVKNGFVIVQSVVRKRKVKKSYRPWIELKVLGGEQ